jgi:hypothetical protein
MARRDDGVYHDNSGGMTTAGNIILEGWTHSQIDALYDKVTRAREPYGHRVSNLPEELRRNHAPTTRRPPSTRARMAGIRDSTTRTRILRVLLQRRDRSG